jgi:flagellar hook-associated protein 3 FlgL
VIRPLASGPLLTLMRVQAQIGSVKGRLDVAQAAVSTGLKVTRPSDDPAVWSRVLGLQASFDASVQHASNAGQTKPLLDTADAAVSTALEVLSRAGELAVQGASEALSDTELPLIADEVDALLAELVGIANTRFGDRYLFGGTAADAPPFAADGTYSGNSGVPTVRVSESVWIQSGFDGNAAYADAFAALADLSAALRSGDQTAVSAQMDALDAADGGLVALQGRVGLTWNQADDAEVTASSLQLFLQTQIDGLVGVDPVEALSDLTAAQFAYETVLAVSATAFDSSLFNYLR